MAHGAMNKNSEGYIQGVVCTRSINEQFTLEVNHENRGDKSPSHLIMGKSPLGHLYQAGLAYKHQINKGDMSGREGFNLLFNDPDFGKAGLMFSAFPNATMGWDLSLRRDERPQQQEAA